MSLKKFFKRTNILVVGWGQGGVEGFFFVLIQVCSLCLVMLQ